VSWRRAGVKYKKNEVFVDVVESVNLLMSATGSVLRADVDGVILMRAYLSGEPECKVGLNDKIVLEKRYCLSTLLGCAYPFPDSYGGGACICYSEHGTAGDNAVELDDCQFHQCVRLTKFDVDRTISFIPPDGEFDLMKYRCTTNVKLPLKVQPIVIEHGRTRVEYTINVKTLFQGKLSATEVVLRIPTPLNASTVDVKCATGKGKYVPEENVIVWKYVIPPAVDHQPLINWMIYSSGYHN
jgi:AP-2 complex subunit mu-1